MTIFSAQSVLVKWFSQHDTLTLTKSDKNKDDFSKIVTLSENPPQDRAAILLALEDFIQLGWLKRIEDDKESYYVLVKPLSSFNQTVELDTVTAANIANLVNDLAPTYKICDLTKIDNYDLDALVALVWQLLEDMNEEAGKQGGDNDPENPFAPQEPENN